MVKIMVTVLSAKIFSWGRWHLCDAFFNTILLIDQSRKPFHLLNCCSFATALSSRETASQETIFWVAFDAACMTLIAIFCFFVFVKSTNYSLTSNFHPVDKNSHGAYLFQFYPNDKMLECYWSLTSS